MAGGEPRLGTASIYMGASYRSPPLKQAKSTQLHGYNSRPSKQIRQRYRPLNRAERGKLRLKELKAKGRLVVHGRHRPVLLVYEGGHVFALDNRCPHMGFPLDRGTIEDGILTCHWHHARFDLQSGCTFDLWADDAPIFPVEVRGDELWVKILIGDEDPAAHWRERLESGLAHDIGLVIAKAVYGELAAGVPR